MGLSISEFRIAMETYGAKRLDDTRGTRYNVKVPCFSVGDVIFLHSGSYYIVNRGREISDEIMKRAMAEFNEEEPGGDNYWYKETHTVKGILTLVLMLENRYSKDLVNELTNETYKKLLNVSNFSPVGKVESISSHTAKMQELYQIITEYDKVVNPYGDSEFTFREPIEYMDEIDLAIVSRGNYININLANDGRYVCFNSDEGGWGFISNGWNDSSKREEGGITAISHYYENGTKSDSIDEVIYLGYLVSGGFNKRARDIDLRISLKTGFAWETYKREDVKLATDEQIELMINYLNKCIAEIRETIISKIVIEKI